MWPVTNSRCVGWVSSGICSTVFNFGSRRLMVFQCDSWYLALNPRDIWCFFQWNLKWDTRLSNWTQDIYFWCLPLVGKPIKHVFRQRSPFKSIGLFILCYGNRKILCFRSGSVMVSNIISCFLFGTDIKMQCIHVFHILILTSWK